MNFLGIQSDTHQVPSRKFPGWFGYRLEKKWFWYLLERKIVHYLSTNRSVLTQEVRVFVSKYWFLELDSCFNFSLFEFFKIRIPKFQKKKFYRIYLETYRSSTCEIFCVSSHCDCLYCDCVLYDQWDYHTPPRSNYHILLFTVHSLPPFFFFIFWVKMSRVSWWLYVALNIEKTATFNDTSYVNDSPDLFWNQILDLDPRFRQFLKEIQ